MSGDEDDCLTIVDWDDSTNIADWQDRDEMHRWAEGGTWHCQSVGWLSHEDADCVVLSARRTTDDAHVGLTERIPRRAITRMRQLR